MIRPNYFEILEKLSGKASEAVRIACASSSERAAQARGRNDGCAKKNDKQRLCDIRVECDKMICSLEDTLFSDFIPPIQRDNIASLAHSFWRVIHRAAEHNAVVNSSTGYRQLNSQTNEEEILCVELAEKLSQNTAMLKHIRNPKNTPSLIEFRETLRRASDAHNEYISRISSASLPHSCGVRASSAAKLRFELSRCFDELIEVMLENI